MITFILFWLVFIVVVVFVFVLAIYLDCVPLGAVVVTPGFLFPLLGHVVVNGDGKFEPHREYITSVVELPIQTMTRLDGKDIKVVLIDDIPSEGFLRVKQVTDIISYTHAEDTKIYKITESGHFYGMWYISRRSIITDKNVTFSASEQ